VYPAFWVFLRRNSFNQLKVSEKIQDWLALLPLILWGVSFVLGANEGEGEQILALLSFVTWVFLSFKMRKMLREYVAGFADEEALKSVARSGIMTFFFLIFYIQYHINRLIDIGVFKRAN
jgi:F0F1-type ATP synthase assembly protein I